VGPCPTKQTRIIFTPIDLEVRKHARYAYRTYHPITTYAVADTFKVGRNRQIRTSANPDSALSLKITGKTALT
jgi:hypothetical protein